MKRGIICIGLILLLVVLPLLAGCNGKTEEATTETGGVKTFKIGVLAGLTGWISVFDELNNAEAEIAAEMINDNGGITVNGEQYNIELVVEDYKSTMDGVTTAVSKLIYDHGVQFIVGPTASFSSATTKICEEEKVLRVLGYCTNQPGELDETTPYAFLGSGATLEHALAGIMYLKEGYPEAKDVILVNPDDGQIPYITEPILNMLRQYDLNPVSDEIIAYSNEAVDFSPIAAKLVAQDADAIMQLNGVVNHAGNLLKSIRETGYDGVFACAVAVSCADIMTIAGEPAATKCFSLGSDLNTPDQSPNLIEFTSRLVDKYGTERTIVLQYANGVWEIAQAVEIAQSFDPTVVRDVWEDLDTIETIYGTGYMGGQETYGIRHVVGHPLPIMTLDNGEVGYGGWVEIKVP